MPRCSLTWLPNPKPRLDLNPSRFRCAEMLPHLRHNLHANAATGALDAARARVLPLRWAHAPDVAALAPHCAPFDLIVGADLVYYTYTDATPHSRLLLAALRQLAAPLATLIYLALSLHHNPEEVSARNRAGGGRREAGRGVGGAS